MKIRVRVVSIGSLRRLIHMMTSAPTATAPTPNWRYIAELALVVSTLAATLGFALAWFLGVQETPIVLGTIAAASLVGWRQPGARLHSLDQRSHHHAA
jgi:hypothetical protein